MGFDSCTWLYGDDEDYAECKCDKGELKFCVRTVSGGVVAGVSIGGLVALVLFCVCLWWCCCRCCRGRKPGNVYQNVTVSVPPQQQQLQAAPGYTSQPPATMATAPPPYCLPIQQQPAYNPHVHPFNPHAPPYNPHMPGKQ